MSLTAAVLTLSDKASEGLRQDESGPLVARLLREALAAEVKTLQVLPDDREAIREWLLRESQQVDLIVTTGGTGPSPRDVTPEATMDVLERTLPGLAEAMRAEGLRKTPRAMLSRAVAGIRGQCLILNLPGSPRAAQEALEAVLEGLPHAVEKIKGSSKECAS